MKDKVYKHSSVLLETPNGELLFHHRDNKPDIINPNRIGTFGGGADGEESHEDAAIREIQEELNYTINKKDLVELTSFHYTRKDGTQLEVKLFILKNVDPKKLRLNPNEGQGIVKVSKDDDFSKFDLTPNTKKAINYWWGINLE